jgi:adenine-specific DNA-methyltransferase
MERLKMQTADMAERNVELLGQMFPNCLTETINADGKLVRAIDFDKLRQELACEVVEGAEERYQFTWPDKRAAIRLANAPTNKTLRPCREESVDFDNTENLYIEGDNLEVLKLLRENYLGKVKMIYIDPPYNTGNDFVYNDDFAQGKAEFEAQSGLFDEEGRRMADPMVQNTESNGRFHTDWLNMIYPRLKVAKDLLTDDGVIFISIDDNEVENLQKVCDEIFGEHNFVAQIPWRKRTAKSDVPFGISQDYEWIVCYAKSNNFSASVEGEGRKYFETPDFPNRPWRIHDMSTQRTATERPNSDFTMINPRNGKEYPVNPQAVWRITKEGFPQYLKENRIVFPDDYEFLNISKPVLRYWKEDDMKKAGDDFGRIAVSSKLPDNIGMSQDGTKEITNLFDGKIFSYPKPSSLIRYLTQIINSNDALVLDFFSGSATTAHAVMQLNAEDGGNRKFIMVQLPELTDEKSEAYKAGYKNICEIGKERIRRAGKKIKEEAGLQGQSLDIGFRVLKLDESNMADVYYTPADTPIQTTLAFDALVDNIREGRTAEDLLFQVLPECNLPLSSKIEIREIHGKKVFVVEDGYLMACFDNDINEAVITAIAKEKPYYFVMCDRSIATDNVADNFDQIFNAYSKETVRRIL